MTQSKDYIGGTYPPKEEEVNEKHWLRFDLDDDWQAIVPNNDIKPHTKVVLLGPDGEFYEAELAQFDCPCKPSVDFKDKIITHNSFDRREENESIHD